MIKFKAKKIRLLSLVVCVLLIPPTPSMAQCVKPIPTINNSQSITVSTNNGLYQALDKANQQNNTTIYIQEGDYQLTKPLIITGSNITVTGKTTDREKVHLKGQGMEGKLTHIFHISANNVTIANIKLGNISQHAIQVHGENGTKNTLLHNLHVYDTGEQMIKISSAHKPNKRAINGTIQWSRFEFTKGIANQYYTGGIDAHNAKDWNIRHNIFSGIRSPDHHLAEHAIHFWSNSENTLVENNKIYNSDRGIGFGFPQIGKNRVGGHIGGIIRNNMIHTNRDVGIGLERSSNTQVYNNSIVTKNYINSIEYRFKETKGVIIINNIVNKRIKKRHNAQALIINNNIENVSPEIFINPNIANLHLKQNYQNVTIETQINISKKDIDCESVNEKK